MTRNDQIALDSAIALDRCLSTARSALAKADEVVKQIRFYGALGLLDAKVDLELSGCSLCLIVSIFTPDTAAPGGEAMIRVHIRAMLVAEDVLTAPEPTIADATRKLFARLMEHEIDESIWMAGKQVVRPHA